MKISTCAALACISGAAASVTRRASSGHRLDGRASGKIPPDTTKQCTYWSDASTKDTTCKSIEYDWGISHKDFVAWNPSVKDDCSGMQVGYSYCVEVNNGGGITTSTSSTSTSAPTSPPTRVPVPHQDGIKEDCKTYYMAVKGDTCGGVTGKYGISMALLMQWNPAVDKDCNGFWAGYYYCVAVDGVTPTTTSSSSPTGSPGPSPTQDGLIASCQRFYLAEKGDTCAKIVGKYGAFSLDDFIKWNPAVGKDCSGLWAAYYYCVGIPGTPTSPTTTSSTPTSTEPANGIHTPTPIQEGMVPYCNKFELVKTGATCASIISQYSISLDNFIKWNPAAGKDCTGLWANTYACVGVLPAFSLASYYHPDCTGTVHNLVAVQMDDDGACINTDCQVASLKATAQGACPDGELQVSYWESAGCTGKWYGYDYTSRDTCFRAWRDGWKWKALHLRCAKKSEDCVSKGECKADPEPANNTC